MILHDDNPRYASRLRVTHGRFWMFAVPRETSTTLIAEGQSRGKESTARGGIHEGDSASERVTKKGAYFSYEWYDVKQNRASLNLLLRYY